MTLGTLKEPIASSPPWYATINPTNTQCLPPHPTSTAGPLPGLLPCTEWCRSAIFYHSTRMAFSTSLHYLVFQFPSPATSSIGMKTSERTDTPHHRYILMIVGILCIGNVFKSESDNAISIPTTQDPRKIYRDVGVELRHALHAGSTWEELMERDAMRLKSIEMHASDRPQKRAMEPLHPGLRIGTGNYIANIAFGTPPTRFSLLIDTGSDITWIQCLPCEDCYSQAQEFFDPAKSASYQTLPCNSSLCAELRGSNSADCGNSKCTYGAFYNDHSLTEGDFVRDNLRVGTDSVRKFAFGCGHSNRGRLFGGAAGLLGLGRSPLSFPSQTADIYGQIFSYCLPNFGTGGSNVGYLYFGEGSIPADAQVFFVPLVMSNPVLYHYYVRLTGISIDGEILHILPHLLDPSSEGGGVIIDSGTLITRLVEPFYRIFRDAFRNRTSHIPGAPVDSIFDTCYKINYNSTADNVSSAEEIEVDVPRVGFVFENGLELMLPAKNVLIRMRDDPRTACLAFAATSDVTSKELSIIGSFQQQGLRVIYDPRNGRIGFAAQACSRQS